MKRARVVGLTLLVVLVAAILLLPEYGAQPFAAGVVQVAAPLEAERLVGDAVVVQWPVEIPVPEALAAGPDGGLWVGSEDTGLYSVAPGQDGAIASVRRSRDLGGFSIGLAAAGEALWSATFPLGFQRIEPGSAPFRLTAGAAGDVTFPEDVLVAPSGDVFFTVGSTSLTPVLQGEQAPYMLWNFLDAAPSGQLLMRDQHSGEVRLLAAGLALPSGMSFSADGEALLVVETARYRVLRYDLGSGDLSVFADGLPGIPDDIFVGPRGNLWVSLAAPRSALLEDWLLQHPRLARLVASLPHSWQQAMLQVQYGTGSVLLLHKDGRARCQILLPESAPPANGIAWRGRLLLGALAGDSLIDVDPGNCFAEVSR